MSYSNLCRGLITDKATEFNIQDLPEEHFDSAVDFHLRHFITREKICASLEMRMPEKRLGKYSVKCYRKKYL